MSIKQISREQVKNLLSKFDTTRDNKPIILFSEANNEALRIIEEVYGDSFLKLSDANPTSGSSHYAEENGIMKDTTPEVVQEFQNKFPESAFKDDIQAIVFDLSSEPLTPINLQYYINAADKLKKPIICLPLNSNINVFPDEYINHFYLYKFQITKDEWLEWAYSEINDAPRIHHLITDFLKNTEDNTFYISTPTPDNSTLAMNWSEVNKKCLKFLSEADDFLDELWTYPYMDDDTECEMSEHVKDFETSLRRLMLFQILESMKFYLSQNASTMQVQQICKAFREYYQLGK